MTFLFFVYTLLHRCFSRLRARDLLVFFSNVVVRVIKCWFFFSFLFSRIQGVAKIEPERLAAPEKKTGISRRRCCGHFARIRQQSAQARACSAGVVTATDRRQRTHRRRKGTIHFLSSFFSLAILLYRWDVRTRYRRDQGASLKREKIYRWNTTGNVYVISFPWFRFRSWIIILSLMVAVENGVKNCFL